MLSQMYGTYSGAAVFCLLNWFLKYLQQQLILKGYFFQLPLLIFFFLLLDVRLLETELHFVYVHVINVLYLKRLEFFCCNKENMVDHVMTFFLILYCR